MTSYTIIKSQQSILNTIKSIKGTQKDSYSSLYPRQPMVCDLENKLLLAFQML